MRGSLLEKPGSIATGSVLSSGFSARIQLPTGEVYGLVSVQRLLSDASVNSRLYALYDHTHSTEPAWDCGTPDDQLNPPTQAGSTGNLCEAVGPFIARIGCDTNFTFAGPTPESQQAAIMYIEENVNEINAIVYEEQLNTTHAIARCIIRTQETDIYQDISTSDGPGFLDRLQKEWATTQQDAEVDMAVLWLGGNIAGNVAGQAKQGTTCDPGVCWVETLSGNLRIGVLAHEVGHVWGASHCNTPTASCCDGPCAIMFTSAPSCSNPEFSECSLVEILERRRNDWCVEDVAFVEPSFTVSGSPWSDGDVGTSVRLSLAKPFRR